jgi:L-serine dehydratase
MAVSVFEIFKIGIGPSSSHTVGPMRAARRFGETLQSENLLPKTTRVLAELFGSLGHTGRGHASDVAVILGLMGDEPETVNPDDTRKRVDAVVKSQSLKLLGERDIPFDAKKDLIFHREETLPKHPNGMRFTAFTEDGSELASRVYYSVGGGFVVNDDSGSDMVFKPDPTEVARPFHSGADLLEWCLKDGISISRLAFENERAWRSDEEIRSGLLHLWNVMQACITRGCSTEGTLPGGLKVPRRAPGLFRKLKAEASGDPLSVIDWVNLYALAVNEENAAGGRVVTAPTNGAAGIIPATLMYYRKHLRGDDEGVIQFLLTAGAIAMLFKENASISGAEVGCQGEVGVACSMAAGALAEVQGGTPEQVENAAEIGMEHNLGLTCDPVGGLVQIPCIERNAMGSIKAINAARMALRGDGKHKVSLDKVIKTMRETGADMMTKYKETARGGLAVNIIEC